MSFQDLDIPASSSTVTVKIFDIVDDPKKVIAAAANFLTPVPAGYENTTCPVYAFLVEHVPSGKKVLFDLGPRKDLGENGAPFMREAVRSGANILPVSKDIVEQLADDGVDLASISSVIWSHSHADHTGDMSKFPPSTTLMFSKNMTTETYETNPWSSLLPSDLAGRKLIPIDFDASESSLTVGGFKAFDLFADGSFYILDVPGHQTGHVCGLARVTPTSFILMGADACHHAGVLRPTSALHRNVPCPGELLAATRLSISPTHVHKPGPEFQPQFDLPSRTTPLLSIAEKGYFEDPTAANESIRKLGEFDANGDVLVILAHDESIGPFVRPYPAVLDAWKEKGWKREAIWAFLDEKNPAFRFK
ncbi:Metallo-beta-lactamase superfamily protein [Favolaschia claudopus]|uniref:Metallo-beta-lactamase superfamily protein n=1 Tax=Favolaschia claudopus TaxID=2862362 RepID=A0AAW0B2N1_9AGAR